MRLWLTGAFAAVSLITAAAVYLFGDKPQALIAAVADRRPRRLPDRGRDLPPRRRPRPRRRRNGGRLLRRAAEDLRAATRSATSPARWTRCAPR